jgi:molybdopterin-guanine dinucleotide biosynthesis adapter protein
VAVVNPYIFQIVGYQNSGKTTFLNLLIEKLNEESIRTGVIKHHGHGGKPDIHESKDSSKYSSNGAIASLVEGDGRILLQAEKTAWSLEEQISVLAPFQLDLVLVEGHKYNSYPKGIIINSETDLPLLEKLSNVRVVFFRDQEVRDRHIQHIHVPHFHVNHYESIKWMIRFLKVNLKNN